MALQQWLFSLGRRPLRMLARGLVLTALGGCIGSGDEAASDRTAPGFAGLTGAAPRANAVFLDWLPASDETTQPASLTYLIYRSTTPGAQDFSAPTFITARGALSYRDSGVAAENTYYYVVRARDEAGNIDANRRQVAVSLDSPAPVPDTAAPAFAGAAGATAHGASSIAVGWNAAADSVSGPDRIDYLIYRATISGRQDLAAPLAVTARGALSFTDSGLSAGTRYFYVVRARDEAGNVDDNTFEVSATTTAQSTDSSPPVFAGANALTVQRGVALTVRWPAASDNLTPADRLVYAVYRATTAGGQNFATPLATTAAGASDYVDDTATAPGTKYYYVVRARDQAGNMETNTNEVFGPVSYRDDIYDPMFSSAVPTRCAACHTAPAFDLSSASAGYTSLLNASGFCGNSRRLVQPGDSAASYLINKLDGTNLCGGSRMPRLGPYLNAEQMSTVRAWIDQGALDN